jgi:hypothetical protein
MTGSLALSHAGFLSISIVSPPFSEGKNAVSYCGQNASASLNRGAPSPGSSKVSWLMRKYPIVEIEDVSEPFCGVRRKNMVTLLDAEPEIAAEWYYEKNCGWGPEHLSRGSGVHVWWQCPDCSRSYKAGINNRTGKNRTACPYCASKRVCEDNSLADNHPELSEEWHPTRNKLKATEVMEASNKPGWWICKKCAHKWKATPADRTCSDSGCPACYEARMEHARLFPNVHPTPQLVLDEHSVPSAWYGKPSSEDFVSLYQFSKTLSRQWHPTRNGKVTPLNISRGSDAVAWWKCSKGSDHEWQSPVYSRTSKKSDCPFCSNMRVSVTNSLATASPALAKEWHPEKNGKLTPKDVIAGGKEVRWWRCRKNNEHEWQADVYRRINGDGCPYCSHFKVSKENCLSNEFPYIAAQMHPTKNGKLTGNDIAVQSGKKIWWKCKEGPDHEWQATPANRTNRGSGCPACAGKQISITNCLATLAPDAAKQWDKERNGDVTPYTISGRSDQQCWWLCAVGHSWQQSVAKRVKSPITCWQCTGKNPPGTGAKNMGKRGTSKAETTKSCF